MLHLRPTAPALLAVLLAACGGSKSHPAPGDQPPPAAEAPPTLRLPDTLEPVSYRARLALDPARPDFTGSIDIDARVTAPATTLWLNAHNLEIDRASLRTAAGEEVALEVVPVPDDYVGLRAPAALAAGPVTISLEYRGRIDEVDTYGVFRQKDGDDWYVYTQFETLAARRAFPSLDEPAFKVPWQLTLEVPADQVALSNTPEVSRELTDHGTAVVTFAQTPPMPTYLLAFAVGPFEIVDAGTSRRGVPLRIITMRGRAGDAAWAAESTLPLLNLLEDFFGTPYPYAKLDSIAIPMTVGFGAMENPGLITYVDGLILIPPGEDSPSRRRRYAYVAAHELGHQWFGNLVSPAWWDDIWLNEAFATWIEQYTIAAFEPDWHAEARSQDDRAEAMDADALASARSIHQPIETNDDIDDAFDSITYEKGSTVIRMFEHWIGTEVFRDGVRRYLDQYQWKNATSAQFLAAIGEAAGRDIATPFNTFLDQVGTPLVSASLRCKGKGTPFVDLTQERYRPLGSQAAADTLWQVPVCVRYPTSAEATAVSCTLLEGATGSMSLDIGWCPEWILPNAGGVGYYRSRLAGDLQAELIAALGRLTIAERVAVVDDARALVAAGHLSAAAGLDLVEALAGDPSPFVVAAAVNLVEDVDASASAEIAPALGAWVRKVFGSRAARLGWTPAPGDDDDRIEIRKALVPLVADLGRDPELAAEAVRLARAWLADPGAIRPELLGETLRVAARSGDAALFDALLAAAPTARSRYDRELIHEALGAFRDPALTARALAVLLDAGVDIRESLDILWAARKYRESRAAALAFVSEHADALLERMPVEAGSRLARVVGTLCDPELDEPAGALLARIRTIPSGERATDQALEQFNLCSARRAAQAAALAAYLER